MSAKIFSYLILLAVLFISNCQRNDELTPNQGSTDTGETEESSDATIETTSQGETSSADSDFSEGEESFGIEPIDGEKALAHVEALTHFGPHPPGSEEIERVRDYIKGQLANLGIPVLSDSFTADTPMGFIPMENVIGVITGESDRTLFLASHYDTKLFYDFSFVGANDGCSSTGLLLEMARALKGAKLPLTLWLVFFDGEEAFVSWSETDSRYGSRHLVERLKAENTLNQVQALILMDMIGDKNLGIRKEVLSTDVLVDLVWQVAYDLGYEAFFLSGQNLIEDDHTPFLDAGVSAIDLIDFRYGEGQNSNEYWHTSEDTLDKLSAQSLQIVGDVVLAVLPEIVRW